MTQQNAKKFTSVHGVQLAYVDRGHGPTLVFLHGNPTSSYLWRHIIAPLAEQYRCIAPDLVGMGDSHKLSDSDPERYSFSNHQRYLYGLLDALEIERPILVLHDWGSALGFEWARQNPERVRGIAYMEAIAGVRQWSEMPAPAQELFRALRSEQGEKMVLEDNAFVEQLMPRSILRQLTAEELDEYRRPFREPGQSRLPTLAFPRQLPIGGEPREICEIVERYATFMATSTLPKLFINAEPGRLLTGPTREACRSWPNQREVTVKGLHYIQEDSPAEISAALRDWAATLP